MIHDVDTHPILEFTDVSAGYGCFPVFRGFTLSLAAGEGVCLVGPNGCGKSTVLRCLLGLSDILTGSINLFGRDVTKISRSTFVKIGIGYVPQGRGVFPSLTVAENIELVAANNPDTQSRSVIDRLIADIPDIARLLTRQAGILSGGEQTLVAIARALAIQPTPKLLVLDEVSSSLSQGNMDIIEHVLKRKRSEGTTIIAAEQNHSFARSFNIPLLEPRWEPGLSTRIFRSVEEN